MKSQVARGLAGDRVTLWGTMGGYPRSHHQTLNRFTNGAEHPGLSFYAQSQEEPCDWSLQLFHQWQELLK